jgi:hypothetical protein
MFEYGYLYQDPDIRVLRFRFSAPELERKDQEHGKDVAENSFRGNKIHGCPVSGDLVTRLGEREVVY